jgi:T-complex protein 1 subunit theta
MGTAGMPYGLQAMLKDGYKHMSGMAEAVMKNLEACKELSKITRTSLGPNGALQKCQARTMRPGRGSLCECTLVPRLSYYGAARRAGMHKIVINHLDRTFVTSDASVMVNELEVQHPAAKLVVMAARSQENEIGDGTNLVRCL